MMYFVSGVYTTKAVNKKHQEMQEYVNQFDRLLIRNELALDALKNAIRQKAAEFDAEYSRTIPLTVVVHYNNIISCYAANNPEKLAFSMTILKVRGFYRFSEDTTQLGGVK